MPPKKNNNKAKAGSASPSQKQATKKDSSSSPKRSTKKNTSGGALVTDAETKNNLAKALCNELWEHLKTPSTPVHAVADQMVQKTTNIIVQDMDAAVAALLTLVCKGAGLDDIADVDATRVGDTSNAASDVAELIARVPNDMLNFPLSEKATTTPQGRRIRRIFAHFFEQLPKTIHSQSLDTADADDEDEDDESQSKSFVETLLPWLGLLSDAKARNFRMAASLALFSYLTGSARVLASLEEAALSTKTKRDATVLEAQIDTLRQRVDEMFSASFHVRTRDVASDIRLTAFQSLRTLIQEMPQLFLTNRHIRYFGVALNDKRSDIRLEALEAISQLLLASAQNAQKLQEFTRYFGSRMMEMKDDVETKVADLAVRTAAAGVVTETKLSSDAGTYAFKDNQVDSLLLCVTDDRVAIRRAAGALLRIFIRFRTGVQTAANQSTDHFVHSLCVFGHSLRSIHGEKMAEKYIVDALVDPNHPLGLTEAEIEALVELVKRNPNEKKGGKNNNNASPKNNNNKKGKNNNKKKNDDDDDDDIFDFDASGSQRYSNTQGTNNSSQTSNAVNYNDADVAVALRLLCAVFNMYETSQSHSRKNSAIFGPISKDDLRVAVPKLDDDEIKQTVESTARDVANNVLKRVLNTYPESEDVQLAVIEALSSKSVVSAFPHHNSNTVTDIINIALKQPTLTGSFSSPFASPEVEAIAAAWQSLASVSSAGVKDVASTALQQLTKAEASYQAALSALSGKGGSQNKQIKSSQAATQEQRRDNIRLARQTLADAWARVAMLAGVTNLSAQWAIFESGLIQSSVAADNLFDVSIAAAIVQGAYHTLLWGVHDANENLQARLESSIPRIAWISHKIYLQYSESDLDGGNDVNSNSANAIMAMMRGYGGIPNSNNNSRQNHEDAAAASGNGANPPLALARYLCSTLCALLDVLSLPIDFALDPKETIEPFISSLAAGLEISCELFKKYTSILDSSKAGGSAQLSNLRMNSFRRDRTLWEAMLSRLSAGFARVLVFTRLAPAASQSELDIAAKIMRLWAKVAHCSKPAGEVLKQLFHTIREQRLADSPTSDVGAVDKAILRAAYNYCINDGAATTAALEDFHAIGSKLAMMHMPFHTAAGAGAGGANTGTITAAERFYPAVPGVVELGIDLAASDDIFLHGVLPYCSRLKLPHARSLIDVLAQNEYFQPDGQGQHSSYARAFVAALRRAAKLDGTAGNSTSGSNAGVFATASVAVGRIGVGGSTAAASTSKPRQMKLGGGALSAPTAEEDDMFNEILRSQHAGARRGRTAAVGVPNQHIQSPQQNNNDENDLEGPSPQSGNKKKQQQASQQQSAKKGGAGKKAGGGASQMTATQQSTNSTEGDEMMLATQEWN